MNRANARARLTNMAAVNDDVEGIRMTQWFVTKSWKLRTNNNLVRTEWRRRYHRRYVHTKTTQTLSTAESETCSKRSHRDRDDYYTVREQTEFGRSGRGDELVRRGGWREPARANRDGLTLVRTAETHKLYACQATAYRRTSKMWTRTWKTTDRVHRSRSQRIAKYNISNITTYRGKWSPSWSRET